MRAVTSAGVSENILDVEYRALVRQLLEQTIMIVAEVDRYWMRDLFREVSHYTSGVFDREYTEEERKTSWDRCMEIQTHFQNEVEPQLNILAYGHPDPDVRRAADVLGGRMQGVIFYYDARHARRQDGDGATTAIQLAHAGLKELRRAAYHAPFRVERPAPEYDGSRIVEPLASHLTDIPPDEY